MAPAPSPTTKRLLAVHAHPDDESSKGAATVAKYVADGVEVLIVTCTGGERGEILNKAVLDHEELPPELVDPDFDDPAVQEAMAQWRRSEMARAIDVLGVQHEWLGFVDSGFPSGDPVPPPPEGSFAAIELDKAAAPLVEVVRRFRPHVITTYDENGGYPHPDHIRTHEVAMEAFRYAGDPEAYPDAGPAWTPLKIYYHLTFSKARLEALHAAMLEKGLESPYGEWLTRWEDRPDESYRRTTAVECADYFGIRDAALLSHASQVEPDGMWFQCPTELQQQVWPWEDYQLAESRVEASWPEGELEPDLFYGISDEELR